MKLLVLDTSTRFLCLGAYDGMVSGEYTLEAANKLSSLLMATIKKVLANLLWDGSAIDYFACGIGPGSFTGLRIGVSTIKGLAWAMGKPVVAVPTLDVIARNIFSEGLPSEGYVAALIDAKRSLMYCGIYRFKNGVLKRLSPYMLATQEEFYRKVRTLVKGKGIFLLGDATGLYKDALLRNMPRAIVLDKDYYYPQPRNMFLIASDLIAKEKAMDYDRVLPMYLYPKDCQVKSKKQ